MVDLRRYYQFQWSGGGVVEVLSIPVEGWWGWWRYYQFQWKGGGGGGGIINSSGGMEVGLRRYYQFQWRDGGGAEEVLTIQVEEEVGLRSYYQYDIVIFSKVRYR